MPPLLPPEITDQIIDHLHDDHAALEACSLTCRGWVVSGQSHIFHNIWIALTSTATRFVLLLETSPHIAQYVKVLVLEKGTYAHPEEPHFLEGTIPLFAPKLVNLVKLRASDLEINGSAFVQNFGSLQTVIMEVVIFETFRVLTDFVLAHPYIKHLELRSSGWKDNVDVSDDGSMVASRLDLCSLSLKYGRDDGRIIDWMLTHYSILHIDTILLPDLLLEDAPAMSRLFQSLGPSLKHIEIGMSYGYSKGAPQTPSITPNTSLRTLCFHGLILYRGDGESLDFDWVPIILSQVTSRSMEEVSFRVWYGTIAELDAIKLEWVDEILAKSHFNGLQRVEFWLYGSGDRAGGFEAIRRKMGSVNHKGLLVFK